MTVKEARQAIKKADRVLTYVSYTKDDGMLMRISKVETLNLLNGFVPEDDNVETLFHWMPDSNELILG